MRVLNRRLGEALALYASVSFAILQAIDLFQNRLGLPGWFFRAAFALLLLGLPVVIATAIVQSNDFGSSFVEKHFTWPRAVGGGVLAFAVLTGTGIVAREHFAVAPEIGAHASVAVLPFSNLTGDAALDYFSDGFTEQLIDNLAKVGTLRVTPRASSFRFRDSDDVVTAARRLRANVLVTGTVRRHDNGLVIEALLHDPKDGHVTWSRTFTPANGDYHGSENEVVAAITNALHAAPAAGQTEGRHVDAAAYDAYLRGIYFSAANKPDSAVQHLREAIRIAPDYADAHGALGVVYGGLNFNRGATTDRYRELAFIEIQKTLALDPSSVDALLAHAALVWTKENGFPHEAYARDVHRALQVQPNSARAHEFLGSLYAHTGLNERALAEFRTAVDLDPTNEAASYRIPRVLMYLGRYSDALDELNRHPQKVKWQEVLALWYMGRRAEAATLAERALRGAPNDVATAATERYDLEASLGLVLASEGKAREAEAMLRSAEKSGSPESHFHHAAFTIACGYAQLHRPAEAVAMLRRTAFEGMPNYPLFARDPALDPIRSDPAFKKFLEEVREEWERLSRVLI